MTPIRQHILTPNFIILHASSKAKTIIFIKTVRYNFMEKGLCEHEYQKLKIFILNYYFYFQTQQFQLKIIFMLK